MTTLAQSRLITSFAALDELASWSNVLAAAKRVELALPGLTPEVTAGYESLIHKYSAVCGCAEGKVLVGALVAGYILYLATRTEGLQGAGWWELGVGFGLSCLGAVIGKVYGLVRARLRLRAVVAKLRRLGA